MTYVSGGSIQSADYNNFLNAANQLNAIWSTGSGSAGYGQSAVGTVISGATITATQWNTLLTALDKALKHEAGSGGPAAVSTGATISAISNLQSSVNTAYTNRTWFYSTGSSAAETVQSHGWFVANGNISSQVLSVTRTVTFSSGDAARYFFNCGGQLTLAASSLLYGTTNPRKQDLESLIETYFASYDRFSGHGSGTPVTAGRQSGGTGKTGTGGDGIVNVTNIGYHQLTTSYQTLAYISSTSGSYGGNYIQLDVKSNGTQGANGDKGSQLSFQFTVFAEAENPQIDDEIWLDMYTQFAIYYPETTNLSNVWGAVTTGTV